MVGREERRILILALLSLLMLSSLYIYSLHLKPLEVEISDVNSHIGEYVEVEGIVKYSKNTTKGTMVQLYSQDGNDSVYLFLLFHRTLSPGYVIRARGIVQIYQGLVEILVKSEGDIEIMKKNVEIGLEELLQNPNFFVGMRIGVSGNLTDIYEIADERQIEITDGINTTWVHLPFAYFGERDIYIYGRVVNGTLYGENITLNSNETCISIGEIPKYEGKWVWVHGRVISYKRIYGYVGWLKDGKYSLKVFLKEKREEGSVFLNGTFIYDEENGMYELIVE